MKHFFEIYKELGDKYKESNINQAYLCYENVMYLYKKYGSNKKEFMMNFEKEMKKMVKNQDFSIKKVAIIMLTFNNSELTKACIKSLRENNDKKTYQLIVVDNGSTDGIKEWLQKQSDIRLIENDENMGFPYGCNQGIEVAEKTADIFLLNNDTIIPENALFWLRMGLYENENTGATGSVSNSAVNYQQVSEGFAELEAWMEYAKKNNVPMEHPYEKKAWLMGFAMLLKRSAIEAIRENGDVLDTRFSPGNYEDNDLSLRLLKAGYQLLVCRNSFIYHYGGKTFQKNNKRYIQLLLNNEKKMEEKYGLNIISASYVNMDLLKMIKPKIEDFSVLEVGCRLGTTLSKLKSWFPKAQMLGIERKPQLAQMAVHVTNIIQGDFGKIEMNDTFHYIILGDIIKKGHNAETLLCRAKKCLKPQGSILIFVKNAQCIKGDIEDGGYALNEIISLFNVTNLIIKNVRFRGANLNRQEREMAITLSGGQEHPEWTLYTAENYLFELE